MAAKGKINASKITTGDRILVRDLDSSVERTDEVRPSSTKTGETVRVARVLGKQYASGSARRPGRYLIETTEGSFEAAPIQTMWLAPEDAAGIKRAYVEALAEDNERDVELAKVELDAVAEEIRTADQDTVISTATFRTLTTAHDAAQLCTRPSFGHPAMGRLALKHLAMIRETLAQARRVDAREVERQRVQAEHEAAQEFDPEAGASAPDANRHASQTGGVRDLTLYSQACNVLSISSEHDAPEEIEMAEYKTLAELKSYSLSNGETADLLALISANCPQSWVQGSKETTPVGTIAYVYAMGEYRRGVVVKATKTKVHVAVTTQGALDAAFRLAGASQPVRVQIAMDIPERVMVAPAPVVEAPAPSAAEEADAKVEAFVAAQDADAESERQGDPIPPADEDETWGQNDEELEQDDKRALTLHSQDGNVGSMNNEASATEVETTPATPENHTGSTVVSLLERVWARIRSNHPELPEVVIITGSGLVGASKWGHFRADGWKIETGADGKPVRKHELFLAGEALAKGAAQVLQTMLHEGAHTLAQVRGVKDTSRQHRWHNAAFKKLAEELGLEHKAATADSSHGFSFVTLTQATKDAYGDLMAELDREIKLSCHLPTWLGGSADGDEETEGGEKIGKAPKGEDEEGKTKSGPLKATCSCDEPIIIRLSQKVLDMGVVRCDECTELFTAA